MRKSREFLPACPVTIRPYVLIKEVAGIQGGASISLVSHTAPGEALGHDSPSEAGSSAGCGQGAAGAPSDDSLPGSGSMTPPS